MAGFVLPPYPYDRLDPLRQTAVDAHGECVDLSVGTPTDPPPPAVVAALASSGTERGYPPSIGTPAYREAAAAWMARRLGVEVGAAHVAACVGSKEFVASLPAYLRLRHPDRDVVLYPAVSYPSYAMGARLAGCRPVAVPVDGAGRLDLDAVGPQDVERALCLWANVPANPSGSVDDLGRIAAWGRNRGVPVVSDECYAEFTWVGARQTILSHGTDGVIALHSLSKRSNLAGARAGFYCGDADLVAWLREVRKHAGLMVPGPVQAAAVVAWGDDDHVDVQRATYRRRLDMLRGAFGAAGVDVPDPEGAFYLWVPTAGVTGGDDWQFAEVMAERVGALVSPGEFYGEAASGHVRVAAVRSDPAIEMVAERLSALRAFSR